jgi:hypothetical protein
MANLGITNILPLTGGNGITITGNKVNLGGNVNGSIVLNFSNPAADNLVFKDEFGNSVFVNPVHLLMYNEQDDIFETILEQGAVSFTNSAEQRVSILNSEKFYLIDSNNNTATFEAGVITMIDEITNTSLVSPITIQSGQIFRNNTNQPFRIIDASSGTGIATDLVEVEINGTTYYLLAKQ